jgi:hypothetical protein
LVRLVGGGDREVSVEIAVTADPLTRNGGEQIDLSGLDR